MRGSSRGEGGREGERERERERWGVFFVRGFSGRGRAEGSVRGSSRGEGGREKVAHVQLGIKHGS